MFPRKQSDKALLERAVPGAPIVLWRQTQFQFWHHYIPTASVSNYATILFSTIHKYNYGKFKKHLRAPVSAVHLYSYYFHCAHTACFVL